GSFAPFAWRMKVRRMPRTPPNRPASKTTLSRGAAWPGAEDSDPGGGLLVQSSCAKTNAAKSTSGGTASVVGPGLNDVVQGSTCATSSRPRVSACSSFACFPDEPRKMRGLSIRSFPVVYRTAKPGLGASGRTWTRKRRRRENVVQPHVVRELAVVLSHVDD